MAGRRDPDSSRPPGTNTAFVLAVLVAVIASGPWWGIVAALISTALITYFFIEPRGPHLPLATLHAQTDNFYAAITQIDRLFMR